MSLRQQQIMVFVATVVVIFGLFATGILLVAKRLTTEATLQTALLLARQVEIALAQSLQQAPDAPPNAPPTAAQQQNKPSSSFWDFLGRLYPGNPPAASNPPAKTPPTPWRHTQVQGLIKAYIDRNSSIQAMWVLNSEGKILYSSQSREQGQTLAEPALRENLAKGITTIESYSDDEQTYYDVLVPLQMPEGARGTGGLRLWINPSDWTGLVSGLWRQFTLLFLLGADVALLAAFLTTALYTRRFRLINEALREAEAGTYQARPRYGSRDEIGTSLDLIDRLVMKQRGHIGLTAPLQRVSVAARTLVHEIKTPLNAMTVHLELLRHSAPNAQSSDTSPQVATHQRSLEALDASARQVDQLLRDFADYSTPVTLERQPLDVARVLEASVEAMLAQCTAQRIAVTMDLPAGPWMLEGDQLRLRQAFDNLLRNAVEAQPHGGAIQVSGEHNGNQITLRFKDSGPGIPPEKLATIFDFGQSTKPGGSGIGLSLSQLIVEAHGGTLQYEENGADSGAVFRLTLPLNGGVL
ncbi:MAG TPA: HAMP domain-containing sensor histidine kinase [Candidatus Binatia bacterium]|jgi:signal transduction histidine kinase